MLKCNIYNLNISQIVLSCILPAMLFVHDNSVCQKCFDLVFSQQSKITENSETFDVETEIISDTAARENRCIFAAPSLPPCCIDYVVVVGRSSASVRSRY